MGPIFTLAYASTLTRWLRRSQLIELLNEARDRNDTLGVTGLLIITNGNVLQILEGEERTVQDLYRGIAADPRHRDVFRFWTGYADHRRHPDWSMAFDDLTDEPNAASDQASSQAPQLTFITQAGTSNQQDFARRRSTALRRKMTDSNQLLAIFAVLMHGHDPETATDDQGGTYLRCRECHITADREPLTAASDLYPCPTAINALHTLEGS